MVMTRWSENGILAACLSCQVSSLSGVSLVLSTTQLNEPLMSVNDFLQYCEQYQSHIAALLVALPLGCIVLNLFITPSPIRKPSYYLYSLFIFASVIPGMLALVIVFYSLFFTGGNLLEANAVLHFLPILTMFATLFFATRKVDSKLLPGVKRLSGLMILIGLVCLVVFFLYKLRFVIGFFSSIESLVVVAVAAYLLMQFAIRRISGSSNK